MKIASFSVAALFLFSLTGFCQEAPQQPAPALPAEILGPPLIVWTQMQKPHPVPDPIPPPDRSDQQKPAASGESKSQEPAARPITGTVVKDQNRYVLRVSDSLSYMMDDQEKARHYEGKQVKVFGSVDSDNILHVSSIELLS